MDFEQADEQDVAAPSPLGDRRVVIIGAGLMGVGIAQVFACAGSEVRLVETDADRLADALPRMRTQLDLMAREGLVDSDQVEAAVAKVSATDDLVDALEPAAPHLVIEAVGEHLELKRALFADLDSLTPSSTLLCTNTSGLSITEIAAGLTHPERVCGAHFWNPPHLIPLVEVVRGAETGDACLAAVADMLAQAGKVPVLVQKDVPGFVGNRLQHALQREAMALVSSGVATAEEVDLVVTQGFGRRLGTVGPLAVCDLAGLDLILQVDSYLIRDLERSPDPDPLLGELVHAGSVGVRSLRGFLEWTPERVEDVIAERDTALIDALRRDSGRTQRPTA